MPDTQYYAASSKCKIGQDGELPDECIYKKQTQWIADHKTDENIKFVMHMGDLVNGNVAEQYVSAVKAHQILADYGVPYSVATGNHEYGYLNNYYGSRYRNSTLFYQYFNDAFIQSSYADSNKDSYYGNWFHGFKSGGSMYATFEVGDLKFAVIALEYAPRKDVLCWADNLIRTELQDRYVILTTHAYLDKRKRGIDSNNFKQKENNDYSNGTEYDYFDGITMLQNKMVRWSKYAPYGASGMEVYKELAARHSNVIMIAGGHQCGVIHREHDGNNKNIIHEFLVDYQCEQPVDKDGKPTNLKVNKPCEENSEGYDAGNGWFVQIQIDPKEQSDNIQVITHSVLEEYENKENGFNCTGSTVKPEKNTDPPYDSDSNGFYKYDGNKEDADHKYSFTIDFTKPIEYQYKNEDTSFGLRNINEIEYGNQRVPKIAMNRKTGEFVAVWEDDSDPSDGTSEYDWTLYVNTGASMMKNINNYDIIIVDIINESVYNMRFNGGCFGGRLWQTKSCILTTSNA